MLKKFSTALSALEIMNNAFIDHLQDQIKK